MRLEKLQSILLTNLTLSKTTYFLLGKFFWTIRFQSKVDVEVQALKKSTTASDNLPFWRVHVFTVEVHTKAEVKTNLKIFKSLSFWTHVYLY